MQKPMTQSVLYIQKHKKQDDFTKIEHHEAAKQHVRKSHNYVVMDQRESQNKLSYGNI